MNTRVPYRIGIFRSVSVSIFRYLQIPYRRQNRSVCRIVRNYEKVRNMIKLKIKGPFWDATKWFSVILRPPFLALKSFPPFCLAEEILTEYWPARHQYLPILARLPVPLVVGYSRLYGNFDFSCREIIESGGYRIYTPYIRYYWSFCTRISNFGFENR